MAKTQMLICPYCGEAQPLGERCRVCRGLFEPLSRQATHNSMGPWFIRDVKRPHRPGCSYETLVRLIERGQIDRFSIIRGPTTRQFWAVAKRVPGVSHLLGYCHNCDAHVEPTQHGCPKCGVSFGAYLNRNYLGLPDIRPLPWEAELDLSDRKRLDGNGDAAHATESRGFSSYGTPAPQRNVGISSFATDEELTGPPPSAAPVASSTAPSSASARGASAGEEPEFVDVPGEEPGLREEAKAMTQPDAGPAAVAADDRMTRTLRSTVMRQQRTIRLLTVLVIVITIGSLAFSAFLISMMPDGGSPEQAAPQRDRAGSAANGAPTGRGVANGQQTDGASLPQIAVQDDNGPGVDDEPAQVEPKPADAGAAQESAAAEEALASIQEARELLEAAADESRSLDDRIADAERAVELLKTAEKELPAASLPEDFAELLKRAETDLERLRLSKFFP